jgi:hypothetical protein
LWIRQDRIQLLEQWGGIRGIFGFLGGIPGEISTADEAAGTRVVTFEVAS